MTIMSKEVDTTKHITMQVMRLVYNHIGGTYTWNLRQLHYRMHASKEKRLLFTRSLAKYQDYVLRDMLYNYIKVRNLPTSSI